MKTHEISSLVSPQGGINGATYDALLEIAKQYHHYDATVADAKNWRISYTTIPIQYGCDDRDFIAIIGWKSFSPEDLAEAGFEPSVVEAQHAALAEISAEREIEAAKQKAAHEKMVKQAAERNNIAKASVIGRALKGMKIFLGNRDYRPRPEIVRGEEDGQIIKGIGEADMGGMNYQPTIIVEIEGNDYYIFIRHLIECPGRYGVEQIEDLAKYVA